MEQINSSSTQEEILKEKLRNTAARCAKHIGFDAPMKIQTTNAQEVYNHYQVFEAEQILILDFRSREAFEKCHYVDSISVPHDV